MKDPLKELFELQMVKAKRYARLQIEGIPQIEAAYKVFGQEIGDEIVKIQQSEIIIKTTNN